MSKDVELTLGFDTYSPLGAEEAIISITWTSFSWLYWVGQKVHSGFSYAISWEPEQIFLANPIKWRCLTSPYRAVVNNKQFTGKLNPANSRCCCSVTKSCPMPCNPMDCSMPGFSVLHYLAEFAQTHVHWVSDAWLLCLWNSPGKKTGVGS